MSGLLRFFAERHLLANLFTIIVLLGGSLQLLTIKRDTFPEVDFGEMVVTTQYPGASPEDVELKVTNEIEDELESVDGIDEYTSFSLENRSIVYIKLRPDESDLAAIKQEVRDAVGQATDLPEEVDESPLVTEIKTSIFPVIEIGLTSEGSYAELRELARTFEKRLEDVPGVARVERFGWRAREIKVQVKPDAIDKYQISLKEIIDAIDARNIRSTGGSFESYTSEKKHCYPRSV